MLFHLKKCLSVSAFALAFSSCATDGNQKNNVRDLALSDFPTDTLPPVKLDIEVPGLMEAWCLDDMSLLRTRDPNRVFYVLNNETEEIIGDFGYKGAAPADFIHPRHFAPLGGNSAWITDMGLRRMYRADLGSKSFPNPKNLISKSVSLTDIGSEVSYGIDENTVFGIKDDGGDSTVFFLKDLASGRPTAIFRHMTYKLPKNRNAFLSRQKERYSYKATAMKPDGSRLVVAHYFSPYISVVATDGTLERIVSISSLDRNGGIAHVGFEEELYALFESVAATDDHIYVVHNMQRNEEVAEISKPVEILVFDWKLNPVRRFFVDEYVLRIGAFPNDRVLLGVDYTSETVFKYHLPPY